MDKETLRSILYSYIKYREREDEDECDGALNLTGHDERFYGQADFGSFSGGNVIQHGGGMFPGAPLQFFPFGEAASPLQPQFLDTARNLAQLAENFSSANPDKSIIKFKEICIVKEPVEQIISIPVIRNEKFVDKVMKASWKTCDKTALSDTHYIGSCGEIVFDKGETCKDIKIKVLTSADEAGDLRFTIELEHIGGLYKPVPATVSLKKINTFYPDEMEVLQNLPRSLPFSISDIKSAIDDCLNSRTFHMGLTHLCSTNNTVDVQIALACELSKLCFRKLRNDSILNVLADFFRKDNFTVQSLNS